MDVHHPDIINALRTGEYVATHPGDSVVYYHLCTRVHNVRDMFELIDMDDYLDLEKEEERHHQELLDKNIITKDEADALGNLLHEQHFRYAQATVDNNEPIFRQRFPSPDYRPPINGKAQY